jgi:hypothetical protein
LKDGDLHNVLCFIFNHSFHWNGIEYSYRNKANKYRKKSFLYKKERELKMKTFYIFECDSAPCRGEQYAVTEQPLSCPYCDSVATEDKPKFIITNMKLKPFKYSVDN